MLLLVIIFIFASLKDFLIKNITAPTTSDYSQNPELSYLGSKTRLELRGSYLKKNKIPYSPWKIVNIYIVYDLDKIYIMTIPALVNCSCVAVSLTKNSDMDQYKYSVYGFGFDRGNVNSFNNGFRRNVIIFWVDMSSSVHVDDPKKDIFVVGKGPTQGLGEHSLTAWKIYPVNFTKNKEKYCLSLRYNGPNSYLFVNGIDIYKFKAKDSQIAVTPLCLG